LNFLCWASCLTISIKFRIWSFISILFIFDYFLILVGLLLSVAFFTLLERKVLGYSHFRKGPTKVLFFGVFQPIRDAVKLFSKESFRGFTFLFYFFVLGPFIGLFLMFVLWIFYGGFYFCYGSFFSLLFIFCFMRLGVYFLLFCCWGTNSKYALIGGYRAISQTVSYEVSLIFFVLFFVYVVSSYDFYYFSFFQSGFFFLFFSVLFFVRWFFVCLSESNRTPFDFSEGESELVSGFNVEYGGGVFSLIFICEYGMIIFLSYLRSVLFFGNYMFLLFIIFICFIFVLIRCCFPRFRYDFLMSSAWKLLLPFSIFFLFFGVTTFF